MKWIADIILKSIMVVLAITLVNCSLLVLSFCLPTAPMRQHFSDSYPLIKMEHQYLQWDQGYTSSMMDFWSEYTLYGAAINEDAEGNAFERAMLMWYIDTPGVDKDKAVEQYARYPDEHFELTSYPRYWNGSVIFMKLFLLFFTIPDIRMINMFLTFALLALTILLMSTRNMIVELIPLITAILFINPITMIYSIVYSVEFIPMLLSIIIILLFKERIDAITGGWELFFAISGSVVSFLSFLSSPFIAFGIPLIVLIWSQKENNVVKLVISSSCYWFGAYIITWAMKWVMCTLFTPYNLLADVFNRVDIYENAENAENSGTTLAERLMHNLWVYKTPAFVLLFIISVSLIIIAVYVRDRQWELTIIRAGSSDKKNSLVDAILGYVLIAFFPILIFIVLGNGYAYNHYFMAHRNLAITVLASLCIVQRLAEYVFNALGKRHR